MGLQNYNDSRKLSGKTKEMIIDALLKGILQKTIAYDFDVSETVIKKIKRELPLLFWNE